MMQHLPQDVNHGHVGAAVGATAAAMSAAAHLADEEEQSGEPRKMRCPNPGCRHKTSKAVCRKCGTQLGGVADPPGEAGSEVCVSTKPSNDEEGEMPGCVDPPGDKKLALSFADWMCKRTSSDVPSDLLSDFA